MELTAQEIADHLHGDLTGDPNVKVMKVARIESGKPGDLCFLANLKYEHYLYTCGASVVIIDKSYTLKENIDATIIRVDNAYESVANALEILNSAKRRKRSIRSLFARISFSAKIGKGVYIGSFCYVSKKAKIGDNTTIHPQCYIGESVIIGQNCIIYPGVKIYNGTVIGNNCIIHSNAVLGSDGFGFVPKEDGSYKKVPQTGIVIVEDDCEIGANTVIDRATIGATLVEKGVKLDNLIQVAHNVTIGTNTAIAAQTGIAGSTKIGKECIIAGQVGIVGHINIADQTKIGPQSGVLGSVKKQGGKIMGSPAINYIDFMKSSAIFKNIHKKKSD